MKKVQWVALAACVACLLTLLGCRQFVLDGPGMERQIWQEFTMVRYSYEYEPIYRYTVKCDEASHEACLYTNINNVEKSIRLESETVDALLNLDILSFPDTENVDGAFLGFSVTDTKGTAFSKQLSGEMEEEILTLLNPYLDELESEIEEEPFMLDGPDMEYQSPWTAFTLSRTDSNTLYNFWFTVTETEDAALVSGSCQDKNGRSYEAETGIPITGQDLWTLRWMDLNQLPDEEPWPEDLELPEDMGSITLTLTLSDGTIETKNISNDLSMEIYNLLLPYLKNN